MTFLNAFGELPELVLGLAFSLACALLLGFVCLKFLVGLMTRQQYNVTIDPDLKHDRSLNNDPSHVSSILWLGAAVGSSNSPAAPTIPAAHHPRYPPSHLPYESAVSGAQRGQSRYQDTDGQTGRRGAARGRRREGSSRTAMPVGDRQSSDSTVAVSAAGRCHGPSGRMLAG